MVSKVRKLSSNRCRVLQIRYPERCCFCPGSVFIPSVSTQSLNPISNQPLLSLKSSSTPAFVQENFFFNEIVAHEHASPFTRTIALRNRISSKLIINYCLATLASSITSLSATSPTFGPFQESCSAFILLNNNFLLEFDCVAGFRTSLLSS